jgi:dipeptide/tripeptide permease
VEETKQMLKMLPVLFVTFVPSMMLAQIMTLFIKQGTTLDRRLTNNFSIPPASLLGFTTFSMLVSIVIYDRVFVKFMRKLTGNPRGITLLQRMGIGMILHILIMIIASITERYRLKVAAEHGLTHQTAVPIPLSIFTLLPQYVLMGLADAFIEIAKLEFFLRSSTREYEKPRDIIYEHKYGSRVFHEQHFAFVSVSDNKEAGKRMDSKQLE